MLPNSRIVASRASLWGSYNRTTGWSCNSVNLAWEWGGGVEVEVEDRQRKCVEIEETERKWGYIGLGEVLLIRAC